MSVTVFCRFNYDPHESSRYETVDPVSVTVPDMSMTVRELYSRFVRKQELPELPGYYDSDLNIPEDFPDVAKLDRTEKIELGRQLGDSIVRTRTRISKHLDDQRKEADRKAKEALSKPIEGEAKTD